MPKGEATARYPVKCEAYPADGDPRLGGDKILSPVLWDRTAWAKDHPTQLTAPLRSRLCSAEYFFVHFFVALDYPVDGKFLLDTPPPTK